ncbi:UNVERIFIED_CONTAM: hypothetical protein PYX00_007768 [Menopon gallinae]|uniref:Uncharacterized protein n=1 Tax=Menopon gallinae TaxID=328185 RepID=A0AAW2HLL4_9NEOP
MGSKWFDFEDDLSPNPDRFELLKRSFGLSSRKTESENLKSWSSVNRVSDIFDLDGCRTGILKDRDKLWDSVIRDRLMTGGKYHVHVSDSDCNEILSDISESARKIRSRFSRDRFDFDEYKMRKMKDGENSPGCSSSSEGFHYPEKWSRQSSCQGNVTFPESSTASINSDAVSEKSFGRSVSINSEESVCTEKSADCSTITETLPDGTNKTQFENNETWLSKSTSGSTICEKKVRDSTVTETNDDMVCDRSTKRTSYVERSATGSSLQEESTSERMVSCDKSGTKTVEQKTSSESYKKAYRSPRSTCTFYDDLESFSPRTPKNGDDSQRKFSFSRGKTVSEKISKLIDEAVQQDSLFNIPSKLETDIDKMTSDFADLKGHFGKEKRKHARRRLSGTFVEAGKSDPEWLKLNELKMENEALLQENSKLQSIIQDVTAVNKRWQKYNNERRLYVQKLLSTIQDLQEQINLISEKSAFRSSRQEDQKILYEDVEKLKREYQEHVAMLEMQVKSHKDDWDAERKEKQKMVHEKEDLERKVQELLREVKFLKNVVVEEKKRKLSFCPSCKSTIDEAAVFPRNEYFPTVSKNFRPAAHMPHKSVESEECFFSDNFMPQGGESYLQERFSECSGYSNQAKKTSGDTIVVEDENGLRLSITEQFPSKDSLHLKSILKKDKKLKLLSEQAETRHHKTVEESCGVTIGFEKDGLAKVTSFSPYADSHEYGYQDTEFLKVSGDNRSKSEPNTRSNSSENLKPLRESSSWNNQCPSAGCSGCDRSFSPSMPPQFLNHFESDRNHF